MLTFRRNEGKTNNSHEVTPLEKLDGDSPQWIDCPYCCKRAQTSVSKTGTKRQLLLRVVSGFFFFAVLCVPGAIGWLEDVHYECAECHRTVATRPHKGPMKIYNPAKESRKKEHEEHM
ncbi:hypothetical protein CGCA056_v005284 [Colletotrichum aenigma]|uniref:uncharacterized protein n=1 Tax=Colletotrichum aenigma TaxID=1215731 RepID=UPI001873023D|nr:uncharacterized protein CGCA056_v005284 [Colletotrichum aenigma]KAF5523353.1 hypothetical protein CGCA056_v005284 [Colletotrichum aenigma]